MKSHLLILILLSFNAYSVENYSFGEFHFGVSQVDSTINEEDNKENGLYYGVGLGHEFKFDNKFNLNTSLKYTKHSIETELLNNNRFSKVKLDSSFLMLGINPTYSVSDKFDIGVKFNTALSSEGILITQQENLKTLVGVNAFYNILSESNKFRVGLSVMRGSVDSSYMQAGLSLTYSFGWTKKQKVMPVKRFKKKVKVTTVTFEEDVVRFENDSAKPSLKSKAFLAEVATFLSENSYMWKHVVISGHTSLAGEKDYNKYLSYKRANAVLQVFKEMGVPQRKIKVEGKGESEPKHKIEHNESEAKENRRVELKFIKMYQEKEFKRFIQILKKKHSK